MKSIPLLFLALNLHAQFVSGTLSSGTISLTGTAPSSQANISVNLWETFEFAAGAGGVTGTPLHNNDHAASGSWSVSDGSFVLSTSVSGQKTMLTTVNGVSDSGTLGLAYDLTGGHSAYVDYVFASAPNAAPVSFGFWVFVQSGFGTGAYTVCAPFGGSSLGNIDLHVNNGSGLFNVTVGVSGTTGSVPWAQWYWITATITQNSTYAITVYDSTGTLITAPSSVSTTAGNVALTQIVFGNVNNPTPTAFTIFFDNIVIDWSNAVYPILPK